MEITKEQMETARALADAWVRADVDLNEVGKLIAHLRAKADWQKTLELARRLSVSGAVRSNQTVRYYRTIHNECAARIDTKASAETAGQILGWAFRLGRFKKMSVIDKKASRSINRKSSQKARR
jgi:hypothetical protein